METDNIDLIKQRASELTPSEKLDLATYLIEQVRRDWQEAEHHSGEPPARPDTAREREMAWLAAHQKECAAQYVVLDGDKLIAHGKDGKAVYDAARNSGVKSPLVTRVESAGETHFWGGWV